EVSRYVYVPWGIFLVGGAGLLAVVGCAIIAQHSKWLGFPLLALVLAVLVVYVPNLFLDHVVITSDYFEVQRGWGWAPAVRHVAFREVKEIRIRASRPVTVQSVTADDSLECVRRNGERQQIELGILGQAAAAEILARAHGCGVQTPDLNVP